MDPILRDALKNLTPPTPVRPSLKKIQQNQQKQDYDWSLDRLPTEMDVSPGDPLPESYELEVWKEMIVTDGGCALQPSAGKKSLGREDRKYPRFKVPKERQHCELKVGPNVYSASLLDESKDGFGLLVDCPMELKVNQKAEIHTYQGWFKVRIVHLNPTSPPKDMDTAANSDSYFQLGMKKRLF
jgi:hypothetical protein